MKVYKLLRRFVKVQEVMVKNWKVRERLGNSSKVY
jgi:hypothetical protein